MTSSKNLGYFTFTRCVMESNYLYFIKLYVPSSEISELWSLFVVLRPSPLCFFNSVKESFSFPMNISFGIQRCHSVSVKKRNAHEKISQYFMYPSSYCFISVLSFIVLMMLFKEQKFFIMIKSSFVFFFLLSLRDLVLYLRILSIRRALFKHLLLSLPSCLFTDQPQ